MIIVAVTDLVVTVAATVDAADATPRAGTHRGRGNPLNKPCVRSVRDHGNCNFETADLDEGDALTGPERRAVLIAHGAPHMPARKLAKLAGIRVDVARRILDAEQAKRAA